MEEQIYLMVDIGLPSGLKWADRNIGAENPWDNGLYFSWGNVKGHSVDENGNVIDGYSFDSDTYETTSGGQYTGNTLDAEHDAATVNMGNDWRMPTSAEIVELVQNTDHYYIDLDGKILNYEGFIIDDSDNTTGEKIELDGSKPLRSICFVKSGDTFIYNYYVDVDKRNFIEFPFAGYCFGSLLGYDGLYGGVWSSSVYDGVSEYARFLYFSSDGFLGGDNVDFRYFGLSLRGVTSNNKQ